jgi:hypothetical protein
MPEREISKADVERVVLGTDARSPYAGKGGATREFTGHSPTAANATLLRTPK